MQQLQVGGVIATQRVVGGCERCSARPDDVCNQFRQRQRLVRAGAAVAPGYILPGCGPQPPQEGKRVSALLTLPLPLPAGSTLLATEAELAASTARGALPPTWAKDAPAHLQDVMYVS